MAQTQAPEKGNIAHGLYVQTVRISIPNLWGQSQISCASHGVGRALSTFTGRRVLLVIVLPLLEQPPCHFKHHRLPDSLSPRLPLHPEPFSGEKSLRCLPCGIRPRPPPAPCQMQEHRLGIWFFSALQVPFLPPGICSQRQ